MDPKKKGDGIPNDEQVAELLERVGYQNLEIRQEPPAIRKRNRQTEIDLSAIAKGFAVDQVAKLLSESNFENFMVEVGGEVVVRGRTSSGAWRIGIEQPIENARDIASVVELEDQAMATSGDYRNFFEFEGKRYSHTIDPATCRPVENLVASSSVIAPDCLTADAMATAVMVMGQEKGLQICRENGWEVSVISRDATDGQKLKQISSRQFPASAQLKSSNSGADSIWPAFIGALVVFALAIAGMAVGAIFNNRPITGSCGGIAVERNENSSSACSLCQKPVAQCPDPSRQAEAVSSSETPSS